MSIESTPSIKTDHSEAAGDGLDMYAILWFWREKPGGGLAYFIESCADAHNALYLLEKHGDPAKYFELVVV